MKNETTNIIRKMTKRTFAIQAAVPAMPKNPRKPAISAITRNVNAQDNIFNSSP
jgi:hypothetical protein